MDSILSQVGLRRVRLCVEIDVVDQDPIPLIRAVAVKVADSNGEILWELPSFAALRSLSDLLRPLPWFYRICNKLL